jgi:O-antigen ligase
VAAWRWREALLLLVAFEISFGHALVGFAVLTVVALGEVMSREPLWLRTPFDAGLLGLLVIALASGVTSEWRSNALVAAVAFGLTAFVMVRATALASLRRARFPSWFLTAWAAGGVAASVWATARLDAGLDARADLPGFSYNELGIALAVALVLLVGLSLGESHRQRFLATAAIPLVALGLALTFSRGAWLGAALGLAVLLAASGRPRRWHGLAAMTLPLIVAAPFLAPRWAWHLDRLRGFAATDGPFSRLALWRVVPRIVADHPWLGTGLATFQFAYERYRQQADAAPYAPFAHNLFLNFAAETGVLGLVALVLLLGGGVLALIRWHRGLLGDPHGRLVSAMALAAFSTLLTHQMVDGTALRVHVTIGVFALLGLGAAGSLPGPRRPVPE